MNIFQRIKSWFFKTKPKHDFTESAQSFSKYYQAVYPIDLGAAETVRLLKNGDEVMDDNDRPYRMPSKDQIGLTFDDDGNVTGKTEL